MSVHPLRAKSANHQRQMSSSLPEKSTDQDPSTAKSSQNSVNLTYQTCIAGFWRAATVTWCKNIMYYSLTITVEGTDGETHHTCKIDLKPWQFWSRKGYKAFEVDGGQVDVYWDFRKAKFSGSPEPCNDYYVALVCGEEVVLLLGDYKKKAFKRTRSRPALAGPCLIHKKETVFAKKSFSTRARFDERDKDHDIVVETSTSGPGEPEMWISIDGIVVAHVTNLQWKFRGNETVVINKHQVQVFWNVHDWLFIDSPGSSPGLFIFKPEAAESMTPESDKEVRCYGGDGGSDHSSGSTYYSIKGYSLRPEYCLFLYAWKIE